MTTETETPEVPEAPAPLRYVSPLRFELASAVAHVLDMAVAFSVDIGLHVELIETGRYGLTGSYSLIEKVREWAEFYKVASVVTVDVERPPERRGVVFKRTPARPSTRVATIHGKDSQYLVARAVDFGLSVNCVGLQRYVLRGSTALQVRWLAACLGISAEQALEKMELTAESAAKEDATAADLPPITVVLPPRQTTSVIDRNRDGDIIRFEQTERSLA